MSRGTTRQLAGIIVTCVVSALLLLAALEWYNQRFSVEDTAVSATEVGIVFVYVVLWGWLLPLSTTIAYYLLGRPEKQGVYRPLQRTSQDSPAGQTASRAGASEQDSYGGHFSRAEASREFLQAAQQAAQHAFFARRATAAAAQNKPAPTLGNNVTGMLPPTSLFAPVTPIPFTFGEDNPWGWLEHCNGRFRGQQLKLTQMVVKLGRGEDVDILLEDERASRYHAELVWNRGAVSIINREGPVLLNGRPIIGPTMLKQGDVFEVGSQLFRFLYPQRSQTLAEPGDPLQHHKRRTPITPAPVENNPQALTKPLDVFDLFAEAGQAVFDLFAEAGQQPASAKTAPTREGRGMDELAGGEIKDGASTNYRGSPVPLRLPSKQSSKGASKIPFKNE
jgi:hypothetical protein